MRKLALTPFMLFFLFVPLAHATETGAIDISEFPERLADALGIPYFGGQILASVILMSFFLFPTLFISAWVKAKDITLPTLFVGLGVLGVCVAIGWFPVWVFVILILLIAIMYGRALSGVFG